MTIVRAPLFPDFLSPLGLLAHSVFDEARKLGEVKEVSGLSWQQDIGLVAEMALRQDSAPCFVFEDVPGTIAGSRVLVNFFGGKRKNMTLGFPSDLATMELSEAFRTHFMTPMTRIPPTYVNDGPIFENVMTGGDVDVVERDDIRHVARPGLRHRIMLNFEGEAEGVDVDSIIGDILERTPEAG